MGSEPERPRRHWFRLAARVARLALAPPARTADLVAASYDRLAAGYERAWTDHMRDLSLGLLDRLAPPRGAASVDLACGTGFLAGELARRTGGRATGVDASAGMIEAARRLHGQACAFVRSDVLEYLRRRPARSADVITCGWGLGYTRPLAILRQASRVLRTGGRIGVIDNSLFSLSEVLGASLKAFAEQPKALAHVMKVRFLPGRIALAACLRACGLAVRCAYSGSRTFHVPDGRSALERLTATGAAAGFEFAVAPDRRDAVFRRFAEILEARRGPEGVPLTHRYVAAVGEKP